MHFVIHFLAPILDPPSLIFARKSLPSYLFSPTWSPRFKFIGTGRQAEIKKTVPDGNSSCCSGRLLPAHCLAVYNSHFPGMQREEVWRAQRLPQEEANERLPKVSSADWKRASRLIKILFWCGQKLSKRGHWLLLK